MSELPSETGTAPQGPKQQHRGLVILVVTLGILLVVGFGVVVATIIYRAGGGNSQQTEAEMPGGDAAALATLSAAQPLLSVARLFISVARPGDGELIGATSGGGRLTLHFRNAGDSRGGTRGGDVVLVVDLATGQVLSRIEIAGADRK